MCQEFVAKLGSRQNILRKICSSHSYVCDPIYDRAAIFCLNFITVLIFFKFNKLPS